jgi:hypothetical protein
MYSIAPDTKIVREPPRSRRDLSQHLLQAGYPAIRCGLANSSIRDVQIDSLLHGLLYVLHSSWRGICLHGQGHFHVIFFVLIVHVLDIGHVPTCHLSDLKF